MPNRRPVRAIAAIAAVMALPAVAGAAEFKLDGKTFTLPDGFVIERVAGTDLAPRPIVTDFDERGRLYVADSSGSSENVQKQLKEKPHRIVRLEDADGDGRFDKSVVFADRMMFPEGAMWHDGSLYVSAPPSIWKLTDTDDDGVADKREEWFQGKTLTGCANDLHGPYLGPDGWIYWCKGAFAEQKYTLPTGKPFTTRAAHVFRARPDGTGVEPVMTGGMDNPVDVVFTPGGERIFSTTFLQNPGGGRRDGLIHAVYGALYGKVHDVLDNHPRTQPDVMPPMTHLGPAAPCGLTRYESDAFGDEYRDNLFCTLFNMHKVTRHVLVPDGATFKTRDSDFLVCDSLDFHPTDVIEDADGSLLVVDTGGWYKLCCPTSQLNKPDVLGAIYRVRRADAPKMDDPRGLKINWGGLTEDRLAERLNDHRPAVRRRGVQSLASRGPAALPALRHVLHSLPSARARLNAAWCATRIDDPGARDLVATALRDTDPDVRQAAAHSASAWRHRRSAGPLAELLRRGAPHNQRAAAEALGRVGDGRQVPALLNLARQANDPVLRHSALYAVIEIGDPAATRPHLASTDPGAARVAMVALDQMTGGGLTPQDVAPALASEDAALRETAAWVAGRHPEWGDALAGALGTRMASGDRGPDLRRQLARMAASPAIQRLLAERLSDPKAADDEHRLALGAIADSGLKDPPAAWLEAIAAVLSGDKSAALLPDAVAAVRRLQVGKNRSAALATPLLRAAARADLPAATRVEALAAVPADALSLTPDLFAFLTGQVSPQQPAAVRSTAADVLGRAKLTPEQLASLADVVKTAGPLEIGRLLPAFDRSSDEATGLRMLAALRESKAARSLRADMVQPRLAHYGPSVQHDAAPLLASLSPDAEAQRRRLEQMLTTLPRGDVRRGQAIFNSAKAACATCHAIGYLGGTVGPDLTRIGSVRAERDLLESILFPSASFTQTYEPVLVDTTDGDRQSGVLRRNDAEEVVLVTGPVQEVRIARTDVKEMRPGTVSIMPAGLDEQLSHQELADLLAFLKACQ